VSRRASTSAPFVRAPSSNATIRIGRYEVEPELLRQRVADPLGPSGGCTALCCASGVCVSFAERDRVLAHADVVRRYMDRTQVKDSTKWFGVRVRRDADFEGGRCVGTRVHGGKCAFLNGDGLCTLQITSAREPNLPQLKPFYCRLFPLVIVDGVLGYDDLCSGEASCCTFKRQGAVPVVEACRPELELALGATGAETVVELARRARGEDEDGDASGPRPVELR
jgi:Fe-S-cluster containining protein